MVPRTTATATLVAVVAVLGALATGRVAFATGVIVSAALAFWSIATALRSGRDALASGDAPKAGAIAGSLLAVRFVGTALLMVTASVAPALLDLWGVVAGIVTVDVTMMLGEGLEAIAGLGPGPSQGSVTRESRRGA
jgi:hypothetical protein